MTDEITLEKVKHHMSWLPTHVKERATGKCLAWAVAEIERLQAESKQYADAHEKLFDDGRKDLDRLTERLSKYRKALEHYRDRKNWDTNRGGKLFYFSPGYEVAEEALREQA